MKNVVWFQNINSIGGVESVIWNVIRKYKDYDITILYNTGDAEQIKRFSEYVPMIRFNKDMFIECDRLFINYGYEMIRDHYKARKVYYVIHADYMYQGLNCVTDPSFEYLGVSEWACQRYYEKCGIMPKLFPNPIIIDEYQKPLLLVSATRIAPDKGDLVERMEKLANRLEQRNIPFLWLVFTSSSYRLKNQNCYNVGTRLDLIPFLDMADYVVQLSDSEACCMTALEAETVGTPMCVTKIPSFYDQGLNEDNAVFFDFDMSNLDECIDKMLDHKWKFKFKAKDDKWGEVLMKGKRKERKVKVKIIQDYFDIELRDNISAGRIMELEEKRAFYLIGLGLAKETEEPIKREDENA